MKRAHDALAILFLIVFVLIIPREKTFGQDTGQQYPGTGGNMCPKQPDIQAQTAFCDANGDGQNDPNPASVNLQEFIAPRCGRASCVNTQSSSFPVGLFWPGNVCNWIEWISNTNPPQFYQVTGDCHGNNKRLKFEISNGFIRLIEDTSWAYTQRCTNGDPAIQRAFDESGDPGFGFAPMSMTCGATFSSSGHNEAFSEVSGDACTVSSGAAGSFTNTSQLIFQGSTTCNGQPVNAIALQTLSGAGAGEVFIYCNSATQQGLCGWYERMDFSKPGASPSNWGNLDICAGDFSVDECATEVVGDIVHDPAQFPRPVGGAVAALGAVVPQVLSYVGQIWPQGNTFFFPDRTRASKLYQDGSWKLMPRMLQEQTTHTTDVKTSFTSRLCVYHPQTGELLTPDFVSSQRTTTTQVPWSGDMYEGSERLSSIMALNKRANQNYELEPLVVKTDSPYPCDARAPGFSQTPLALGSQRRNTYGAQENDPANNVLAAQTPQDANTGTVQLDITITEAIAKLVDDAWQWSIQVPAFVLITHLNPYFANMVCRQAGCNNDQIQTANYLSENEKNRLGNEGGWIETQLPGILSYIPPILNGRFPNQPFDQTILAGLGVRPANTNISYTNLMAAADTYHDCRKTANMLQSNSAACVFSQKIEPELGNIADLNPNTSDWAIDPATPTTPIQPNFPTPFTDVDLATAIRNASDGKIPMCVLEAVKYIETGPNWTNSSECKINRCSAAGPFQLTTGKSPYPMPSGVYQMSQKAPGTRLDTQCRQCGNSWADGSRTCPDAWPGDWPPGSIEQSPCNVEESAKVATDLLQAKAKFWTGEVLCQQRQMSPSASIQSQRDTIIIAGNSYYGDRFNSPIPRLDNCSYGEFVYKHCDPSYRCGTARIPDLELSNRCPAP